MPHITDAQIRALEKRAQKIRLDLMDSLTLAGSGHSAGPLGLADVFTALYFHVLKHDPKKPTWKDRDRLILSSGHVCPIRYVTMAHAGYFPRNELKTLRAFGTRLQGHPEYPLMQALESTSGPLGEGIAQAAGVAYAARLDGGDWHTYCVTGDGELQEGICWEAFLFAAKEKLSNLTYIVDRNHIQIDGFTEDVTELDPLAEKFEAFGFHVVSIDGHSMFEFIHAVEEAKTMYRQPTVILANTIPGKGVKYMEKLPAWHGAPPGKGPEDVVPRSKQHSRAVCDLRTLGGSIMSEHE